MSQHLHKAIEKIKKRVLTLSTLVEENVARAVRSVEDRDIDLARQVIACDAAIDLGEIDVEEECLKILALYQPVAVDLRFIISVLKLNSDLERIGDLAVNIAERAVFLSAMPKIEELLLDFQKMFEFSRTMLKQSLDALINLDTAMAIQVCASDDELDDMNRHTYVILEELVLKDPNRINQLFHYLSISRCLERIGDHATNISEDVIYMTKAKIVRHNPEKMPFAGS